MSDKKDPQFDADELIDSLYQDSAGEQPPVSLDNLILAKARGQTTNGPQYRKARWHVPVILCTVPAIALAVVLKLGNFGPGGKNVSLNTATSTDLYSTEEFVLHIPKASDAIERPEKPDFSADVIAKNDLQNMTAEAQIDAQAAGAVVVAKAEAAIDVPVAAPELVQRSLKLESETPEASEATSDEAPDSLGEEVLIAAAASPAPQLEAKQVQEKVVTTSAPTRSEQQMEDMVVASAPMMAPAPAPQPAPAPAADVPPAPAPPPASSAPLLSADIVAMSPPPAEPNNLRKRQATEKTSVSYADNYQECPPRDERGEMCPDVYQPVCAERDTGVRCVMAPCAGATEMKNYSNACYACADLDVYGYYGEGACEDLLIENNE